MFLAVVVDAVVTAVVVAVIDPIRSRSMFFSHFLSVPEAMSPQRKEMIAFILLANLFEVT